MRIVSLEKLISEVRELINQNIGYDEELNDDELKDYIRDGITNLSRKFYISREERLSIYNSIFNNMRRLDILQPLIDDEEISEVMVNGHEDIFIEKGGIVTKTDLCFESVDKLYEVIQNIVSKVNRIVNERSPIVDARLENGSRVNVILPPVALNGPILTIRKFTKTPLGIKELVALNSLSQEAADLLVTLVASRYNIFICGGTSSGKTTLLNALANSIPISERVIVIEDSSELRIDDIPNTVRLEARMSNTEGRGEISIRQLIRASLRMRPDRIVVGEVRGKEAVDMLQAMNTGHDGSLSTGHANSAFDMISRLETMILSEYDMPIEAIHKQITSAIDIIVFVSKLRDNSRRIVSISELLDIDGKNVSLNDLYKLVEIKGPDHMWELRATGNSLIKSKKLIMNGCDHG